MQLTNNEVRILEIPSNVTPLAFLEQHEAAVRNAEILPSNPLTKRVAVVLTDDLIAKGRTTVYGADIAAMPARLALVDVNVTLTVTGVDLNFDGAMTGADAIIANAGAAMDLAGYINGDWDYARAAEGAPRS